ncbi:MAG TPA: CGNR zinc finger domain-containing protein [Sphingomicrobium sp.]|nr:CGNR zinc finger domain-containing protein [Sphingomicrobium sp.]
MPEHRPGTPAAYAVLESFLWWDFSGADDWVDWAKARGIGLETDGIRSAYARVIALQQALRRLEAANGGAAHNGDAIAFVNTLIARLKVRPKLSPSGEINLSADAAGKDDPVATLLLMVLETMAAGDWKRFKLCREPTCSASFYDSSKSATKVWCSMALCGSRDKMRRLRQRQKA